MSDHDDEHDHQSLEDRFKMARMVLHYKGLTGKFETNEKHLSVFLMKVYGYFLPEWLEPTDRAGSSNWMDMDNMMTLNITLLRYFAERFDMLPEKEADFKNCEELEKLLFKTMNRMTFTINKLCYAPNSGCINSFDPSYAVARFMPRCAGRLTKFERAITGPFILGEKLVYADFILYATLHDFKDFVPKCFDNDKHPKIKAFMEHFEAHPALKEWFAIPDAWEFIRPTYPNIEWTVGEACIGFRPPPFNRAVNKIISARRRVARDYGFLREFVANSRKEKHLQDHL